MNAMQVTTAASATAAMTATAAQPNAAQGQTTAAAGFAATLSMLFSGSAGNASQQATGTLLPFALTTVVPETLAQAAEGDVQLDLAALLEQLQSLLEAGDPEALALMEDPAMQQWMDNAELAVLMLAATVQAQPALSLVGESPSGAGQNPAEQLMGLIQRLSVRSEQPQSIEVGQRLQTLADDLIPIVERAIADHSAKNANVASSAFVDKLTSLLQTATALKQSASANVEQRINASGAKTAAGATEGWSNVVLWNQPRTDAALLTKLGQQSVFTQAAMAVQTDAANEGASGTTASADADMPAVLTTNAAMTTDAMKAASQPLPAKPAMPTMNAQTFADDFTQLIVKDMKIAQFPNHSEATIRLMPEHLGEVSIKLSMQNGQLTAHFAAETALGRELLENQLPQLRAALQHQGIQVNKIEVNPYQQNGGFFQDAKQSSQHQQQHRNRGANFNGFGDETGLDLETQALLKQWRSGTSFEVTA